MAIDITSTLSAFNAAGIDINADFHTLTSSQVDVLVDLAKTQGYRKPVQANGSTARYYFAAVQRKYTAWKRS